MNSQIFSPILAVDPSLRSTGYAILAAEATSQHCLAFGVIPNPPHRSQPECLLLIRNTLANLIRRFQPVSAAVEGVIFVQSYRTAITLGAARGAALIAMAEAGLAVHEYAPRRVKQAVVGRGGAGKDQVAFMVRALLGLTETPPADAADAIAVGLTHLREMSGPLASATAKGKHL
jgi:crossover junction endodeoxyribonuclease RuvC